MIFKPLWQFTNYLINKEILTELFCINVDKPELECEAKCHITNEVAKNYDDNSAQNTNSKTEQQVYNAVLSNKFDLLPIASNKVSIQFFYTNLYQFSYQNDLLKPPICL